MDAYLREIRKATKVRRLFRSMGWKEDGTKFVLGERLYAPGEVITTGSSARAAGFLTGFRSKGELAPWRDLTSIFATPGLEPHAFMLLAAFAAPLLELGGRDGFTISALGETNAGKSTMGTFLASVYGSPKETWLGRLATANARIERLGSYNSIPVYMDEITTIEPKDLREIIYMIPTGKGKDALNRNRESREGAKWQTILVVSTNDPLHGKLQEEKANPEAESMRLFEFDFPTSAAFQSVATLIHGTLAGNYGVAGAEYIRQLVEHQAELRREIPLAIDALEREFQMEGRERFWSQAAALALYGGKLARQWGLIDFDPEVIRPWLLAEIQRMRKEVKTNVVTSTTVIGEYLDAHVGERLVVTKLNIGMSVSNTRPTRGALSQRYEKDIETLWVTRSHILHWLRQRHHNPNQIKKDLIAKGILLNPDDRKILGAGTDLSGGQQVPCWKLRADCPELAPLLTKEV